MSKATVALGCGLLAAGMLACSGDDAPSSSTLSEDLAILKDQQGFTDAEVTCVVDHVREDLSGEELDQFARDLEDLARTSSLDSMGEASRATLTKAITACAGG